MFYSILSIAVAISFYFIICVKLLGFRRSETNRRGLIIVMFILLLLCFWDFATVKHLYFSHSPLLLGVFVFIGSSFIHQESDYFRIYLSK